MAVCLSISLLIPSGCSKGNNEGTWYHERMQETAEDPASTPNTTSTPTPVPISTNTPTPSPAPVITVDNAVDDTFGDHGYTYVHRVPMVSISNVDTTSVNDTMFHDIESNYPYGLLSEEDEYYGFETDYSYYISDQFISIIIKASAIEYDYGYIDVYNISIADGTLVSGETFITMLGEDPDAFFETVRETYANWGAEERALFL